MMDMDRADRILEALDTYRVTPARRPAPTPARTADVVRELLELLARIATLRKEIDRLLPNVPLGLLVLGWLG